MAILVKNVTDVDLQYEVPVAGLNGDTFTGIDLFIADIPLVSTIKWKPGQTIDLETVATVEQIDQSRHLKVHVAAGRMTRS